MEFGFVFLFDGGFGRDFHWVSNALRDLYLSELAASERDQRG